MAQNSQQMMLKPGYLTTEFWLSVAAIVVSAIIFIVSALLDQGLIEDGGSAAAVASTILKIASAIATMLSALGYTVSRVSIKSKAMNMEIKRLTLQSEEETAIRLERIRASQQSPPGEVQ